MFNKVPGRCEELSNVGVVARLVVVVNLELQVAVQVAVAQGADRYNKLKRYVSIDEVNSYS